MKQVYAVIEDRGYDGIVIWGIYSTMEQAKKIVDLFNGIDEFTGESLFRVEKYDLDTLSENSKYLIRLYFENDHPIKEFESLL